MKISLQLMALLLVAFCFSENAYSDDHSTSSPKADFFKAVITNDTWGNDWIQHYSEPYAGNPSHVAPIIISHSETIKKILESDYGVIVPFDPGKIDLGVKNQIINNYISGQFVSGEFCAALTPVALSNAVSAVTLMVAPELEFPTGSQTRHESTVRDSSKYLERALGELNAYCSSDIPTALNKFLDEYKQIISMSPTAKMEAREKEAAKEEKEKKERSVIIKKQWDDSKKEVATKPATPYSPKTDFFRAAITSDSWTRDWGYHYSEPSLSDVKYNPGFFPPNIAHPIFISHSETIKKILESDYGVIVPFDPSQIARGVHYQIIGNYVNYGSIASGDYCAALTPVALSNAVSSVTAIVALELGFPLANDLRTNERDQNTQKFYLKWALKEIAAYCATDESKKILPALNQFLEEYKQIITQEYTAKKEAEEKERQRIADEKERQRIEVIAMLENKQKSGNALDVDELIMKRKIETEEKAQSENDAKSLNGTVKLYMQSRKYPTILDFLRATTAGGRSGQEDWQNGWRWSNGFHGSMKGDSFKESAYRAVAGSYLIKSLLEKEYGLTIPFDTDSFDELFFKDKTVPNCSFFTPTLLSSGILSIGNYTESTFLAAHSGNLGDAGMYKNKANLELGYLAGLFTFLDAQCEREDRTLNGENSFIKAYKKLLNGYASALEVERQDEMVKLTKEAAGRSAAEAEKRAANEKAQQALTIAMDEHLLAVRSGKLKPETIEDAKALWQPSGGIQIVLAPPVKADSKAYIVSGKLVRMDGGNYIFEVYTGNDIKYFSCAIKNGSVQGNGTSLRFESNATMVGRFVDVTSYTTVAGVTRMAPVFDVLFIQN